MNKTTFDAVVAAMGEADQKAFQLGLRGVDHQACVFLAGLAAANGSGAIAIEDLVGFADPPSESEGSE